MLIASDTTKWMASQIIIIGEREDIPFFIKRGKI